MLKLLLCCHSLLALDLYIARENILHREGWKKDDVCSAAQLTRLPLNRHAQTVRLRTSDEESRAMVQVELCKAFD